MWCWSRCTWRNHSMHCPRQFRRRIWFGDFRNQLPPPLLGTKAIGMRNRLRQRRTTNFDTFAFLALRGGFFFFAFFFLLIICSLAAGQHRVTQLGGRQRRHRNGAIGLGQRAGRIAGDVVVLLAGQQAGWRCVGRRRRHVAILIAGAVTDALDCAYTARRHK